MLVAGFSAWMQSAFGHDRHNPVVPDRLQRRGAGADGAGGRPTFEYMGGQAGVFDLSLRESQSRWSPARWSTTW